MSVPDYVFKIIVVGPYSVGKTALSLRWVKDYFESETKSTLLCDMLTKTLVVDGKNVKVVMYDTAGQEQYSASSITSTLYKGAHACLFVYDLTDAVTFSSLRGWLPRVAQHAAENFVGTIVGNKVDLIADTPSARAIDRDIAVEYAEANSFGYTEVSARTGDGVGKLFDEIIQRLIAQSDPPSAAPAPADQIRLPPASQQRDNRPAPKKCC